MSGAPKRERGHRWVRLRALHWLVCWGGCGLILLKNPASQAAARTPCRGWDE